MTPALIIGAGPAGLAVSACLTRHGVEHVVLEREEQVAPRWRNHYERLHLHTFRDLSRLPHKKWKRGTPRYPSREQVVEYMDDYARELCVQPQFGQAVELAERINGAWRVRTQNQTFQAESLIVATGYNRTPHSPTWPGQDGFQGDILHSHAYRNGTRWKGKRVLVVGSGNSGAEIAIDLVEHGAEVAISIRGPIHFVARDVAGVVPAQIVGIALSQLPPRIADHLAVMTSKMMFGDLSSFGVRRPEMGPITQIWTQGRVPLIDVGTIELIKNGTLTVFPGIERFYGGVVEFVDGRREDFDAILLATGYRAAIDEFLDDAESHVNERGYPKVLGAEAEHPGPYFVGFGNPPTGLLREINQHARAIAAKVAAAK
jgi:pyruvate/2-oxoglutarate dehydrogenase complex dihydrolipoamide dehydrogenase (E3) component